MWAGRSQPTIRCMLMTGSDPIDAERAFARSARARRRAAVLRRLPGRGAADARLAVYEEPRTGGVRLERGIREIPLCAIRGTLEPSRARMFDGAFRPAGAARTRWQRVWMAEQRGEALPPIAVTRVGDVYAVRDGHHRVSVARARGALTIDATLA
jgi:hypothetical protein